MKTTEESINEINTPETAAEGEIYNDAEEVSGGGSLPEIMLKPTHIAYQTPGSRPCYCTNSSCRKVFRPQFTTEKIPRCDVCNEIMTEGFPRSVKM